MRFSNFHQHTTFSDGKSTAEEVVQSAIARGMEAIGISDHSHTAIDESYCMMPDRYEAYFAEIARLRELYKDDIRVYTGLEMDYFSECDRSRYDYIIGSVHYMYENGVCHPIDHSLAQQQTYLATECGGDLHVFAKNYYAQLVDHIEKNRPDIVGHIDVISKFGLFDEDDPVYREIALNALDRILKVTPVVEMNTGAITRGVKDVPYPHPFLLDAIRERGGEIILGADSHAASTVDGCFDRCLDLLRAHGYDHIVTFDEGHFRRVDI